MGKRTPHYGLMDVQAAVAVRGIDCFTRSAQEGAAAMGLASAQALVAIQNLTRQDFHKSMTTYADHAVWQDVYHCPTAVGLAYVKFTLREDGSIVISFKEL